ncbi:MAG: hypothetical protein HGA83_07710 [Bacteroidales bacterium]|nr:hypothetical protein [Bacteroidales bacterium]
MTYLKVLLCVQLLVISVYCCFPVSAVEVEGNNGKLLDTTEKAIDKLLLQIERQRYGYDTKWQKSNKDSLLSIGNSMYLGKKVSPVTFEYVKNILTGIPKIKNEYETTISFQSRLLEVLSRVPKSYVLQVPLDKSHIKYNADDQLLIIDTYAVDNTNTRYEGVFGYGTPFYEKIDYINDSNMDVVVSSKKSFSGSYWASNAFGIKAKVNRSKRNTSAVFDGVGALFDNNDKLAKLIVSRAQAPSLKASLKAALVVVPKHPYFLRGKVPWDDPTIYSLVDIDEDLSVIIADIQFVLITDSMNNVLAVYVTN